VPHAGADHVVGRPQPATRRRVVDAVCGPPGPKQQEAISKLTPAQHPATLAAMKTAPSPGKTLEALQAKVSNQLTSVETTVHRISQMVGEALATGDAAIVEGALEMTPSRAATQGAGARGHTEPVVGGGQAAGARHPGCADALSGHDPDAKAVVGTHYQPDRGLSGGDRRRRHEYASGGMVGGATIPSAPR
jgi:hypothetical protein